MPIVRKLTTWAIVLGVILWIVLSYLPRGMVALPVIRFPAGWVGQFGWVALAGLAVVVAIQLVLLWRVPLLRQSSYPGIRLGKELFWTALPLLMTLALAATAYRHWPKPGG